jgi:hypothetical protein
MAFRPLLRRRRGVALLIQRDRSIVCRPERIVAIEPAGTVEAQKAIEQLNGADCEGQPLTVNEAKPQKKRKTGFGGRRR